MQTDVYTEKMELLKGDLTQPNTDAEPTVLLLPTTYYYYRFFVISLHTTPYRNSNATVTSHCTPEQGTKLLHLLVQTTWVFDLFPTARSGVIARGGAP